MQKKFSYPIKTDELDRNSHKYVLQADKDELEDITSVLKVEGVRRLYAEIYLKREKNLLKVSGVIEARVEQKSVISLENFCQNLKIPFEMVFDTEATYEGTYDPEASIYDEIPDIIENNTLDLADICLEQIALNLDDYPRAENEKFDYSEYDKSAAEKPENPFAVLKKLKK